MKTKLIKRVTVTMADYDAALERGHLGSSTH